MAVIQRNTGKSYDQTPAQTRRVVREENYSHDGTNSHAKQCALLSATQNRNTTRRIFFPAISTSRRKAASECSATTTAARRFVPLAETAQPITIPEVRGKSSADRGAHPSRVLVLASSPKQAFPSVRRPPAVIRVTRRVVAFAQADPRDRSRLSLGVGGSAVNLGSGRYANLKGCALSRLTNSIARSALSIKTIKSLNRILI
jgi:hypothetical protein